MANLIKYHNKINEIPLRNFNEKELNLFFSILYQVKDKGSNKIDLNFIDLKKIALTGREDKRLINSLKKMNNKLLDLKQEITLENGNILMFNLFNTFLFDLENKKIKVEINENFVFMLNNLVEHFTMFELTQLIELRSSYSKNAFRLMKQWESINKLDIELDEFKRILCIPKSYRMSEITKWVLTPIMEELSPIFSNLKLEKIKNGRKITNLKFTWSRESLPKNGKSLPLGDTKVVEISEGLNKAIEKAKKNRFISSFMTTDNIEKLLKLYGDQKLIKGLHFASSEIDVEVKKLIYIINSINMGLEKETKKIVIKKSEPKDLQDVELKNEKLKELTEEIKEPKNEELKDLIKKTMVKGKEKLKGPKYYTFMGLLNSCKSSEEIRDLILKYELN